MSDIDFIHEKEIEFPLTELITAVRRGEVWFLCHPDEDDFILEDLKNNIEFLESVNYGSYTLVPETLTLMKEIVAEEDE